MLNLFISTAHAQTGAPAAGGDLMLTILMFGTIIGIFYLLIWRPQAKRANEHAQMLATLRRGDKVLTTGGFHVEIVRLLDDSQLEVAFAEGQHATLEKQAVVKVMVRATEAREEEKPKAKAGKPAAKSNTKSTPKATKKNAKAS